MKDSIGFIQNNLVSIASLLFGAISIILAIYFYLKSVKQKKPLFTTYSFNLLDDKLNEISNLEIKYLNKEIKNLTATKIAVWNGGKDTINKIDIPENAPLIIKAKDNIQIYSAELSFTTENTNQLKLLLVEDLNEILIDFEYLDYTQGGIITVLHSGNSSSDLIVEGKIKGAGIYKESDDKIGMEQPINFLMFLVPIPGIFVLFGMLALKISLIICGLLAIYILYRHFIKDTKIPMDIRGEFRK